MLKTQASRVWKCSFCSKTLSSKRSFDEHINIHTTSRPFACDNCQYAAASQMTLRRHVLRKHTPKQNWGYRCPYCDAAFMEPASYQHHVTSRHFGRSLTFGCPRGSCTFRTKCSRHLQEHLLRHAVLPLHSRRTAASPSTSAAAAAAAAATKADTPHLLRRFLVDDEFGGGFGKTPLVVPEFQQRWARRAVALLHPSPSSSSSSAERRRDFETTFGLRRRAPSPAAAAAAAAVPDTVAFEVEVADDGPARLPDGQVDLELD